MAGDWLKMELCLPDKPEVLAMSALTGMEPDLIVGKCFRVWRWFDQHTEEGNAAGVTLVTLGYAIGNGPSSTTFLDAMKSVGWVEETQEGVRLPNFDRHNGETAKKRALTAKRVAKHKATANAKGNAEANSESNADSVSRALPREEKRREVNTPDQPDGFAEFWLAYPRKVGKGAAEKAFRKSGIGVGMLQGVLQAIERARATEQWRKSGGQFIPHPATWLNERRWEDDAGAPVSATENPLFAGCQ